jgi:hypothetical protein
MKWGIREQSMEMLATDFVTLRERKLMALFQRRKGPNVVGFYRFFAAIWAQCLSVYVSNGGLHCVDFCHILHYGTGTWIVQMDCT